VGRAVVALAEDPAILERSGQPFSSWELGREYRFTDSYGRRPDWGASKIDFSKHLELLLQLLRTGSEIQIRWLSELRRKTKHFFTQLPTDEDQSCPRYADGIGPGETRARYSRWLRHDPFTGASEAKMGPHAAALTYRCGVAGQ
jgi:hypothetical protein